MTVTNDDRSVRVGIMRYGLSFTFAALALFMVAVGILSLTVWAPSQEVEATGSPSEPYTITRVGVLPLYSDDIKVTVAGDTPTEPVAVAAGEYNDVVAWLANKPYDEIVGLETLTSLKMQNHAGVMPEERLDVSDDGELLKSDMWFALYEGRGAISFSVPADQLQAALLITTSNSETPYHVTLTWQTPRSNILAWVTLSFAAVFLLLGVATAVTQFRLEQSRIRRKTILLERDSADNTDTGMIEIIPPAVAQRRLKTETPEQDQPPETAEEVASTLSPEPVVIDQRSENEETALDESEPREPSKPVRTVETITTDSGMMNMSALRDGVKLPSRRALREAKQRGVEKLMVEGKEYSTLDKSPEVAEAEEVLSRRPTRQVSSLFRKKRRQGEKDE